MAAAGGDESSGRPDDDDVRDEESMRNEMLREKDPSAPMPVTACVVKGVGDAMAGAVMGSVFGFGTGLFQKRGFKGALDSGLSSAKNFALLSGIHGFVSTLLFQIRGKKDAINAGIAGCATGVALSVPGNPAALLQGCATFGVFSYLIEKMNNQAALAAPIAECARNRRNRRNFARHAEDAAMFPSLPPFTLAPSFMEGLFLFNQPKQHLLGFNSS